MAVVEIRSLLPDQGVVLGSQKAEQPYSVSSRLGLEQGTPSLAAVRLRLTARCTLRTDLGDAVPVQATICTDGEWLFEAIDASAAVRSVRAPGSESRRLALDTPGFATLTDARELAVAGDPRSWPDLLTVVPVDDASFVAAPRFVSAPTPSRPGWRRSRSSWWRRRTSRRSASSASTSQSWPTP